MIFFQLSIHFSTIQNLQKSVCFIIAKDILAYEKKNKTYPTRWNLDKIVEWLEGFVSGISEDSYPVPNDEERLQHKRMTMQGTLTQTMTMNMKNIIQNYFNGI